MSRFFSSVFPDQQVVHVSLVPFYLPDWRPLLAVVKSSCGCCNKKPSFVRAEGGLFVFGNPAVPLGPVVLRPRIASGLLLSDQLHVDADIVLPLMMPACIIFLSGYCRLLRSCAVLWQSPQFGNLLWMPPACGSPWQSLQEAMAAC